MIGLDENSALYICNSCLTLLLPKILSSSYFSVKSTVSYSLVFLVSFHL